MLKKLKDWLWPKPAPVPELPEYLKAEIRCIAEETMDGDLAGGLHAMRAGNSILEFVNKQPKDVQARVWEYIRKIRSEADLYAARLKKDSFKT